MKQASLLLLIGSLGFAWLNMMMTETESKNFKTQKFIGEHAHETKARLDAIIEEVLNKGITENIDTYVAEDYLAQSLSDHSFRFEGRAQFKEAILRTHFEIPGYRFHYEEFLAYDERIVIFWPNGKIYPGGIPAISEGPPHGDYGIAIFSFEDGKLDRSYFMKCSQTVYDTSPQITPL